MTEKRKKRMDHKMAEEIGRGRGKMEGRRKTGNRREMKEDRE